jgi:hypothetical protein
MASQVEPLMTPDHSIIAPLIPIPPEESIIASLEETRLLLLAATPFVVTPKHLKNIKVYLQLLSEKVHQNAAKKRAQRILLDIIDSSKRLFLLCALATNLTFLGKIRSHDGHWSLITWWKTIPHPPALDLISDCYAAEFEAKKGEQYHHHSSSLRADFQISGTCSSACANIKPQLPIAGTTPTS